MRSGSAVALSLILFGSVVSGGAPVAGKQPSPAAKRAVWQNQPFIALTNGHFQGTVTVDEAKRHGNLGIGALDRLNGEVLVLDGVLYQFPGTGGVRVPSGNTRLAFAIMARFVPGKPI